MNESSHSPAPAPAVGLLRRLASIAYDLLLVTALLMVLTGLVFAARAGTAFDPQSVWFRLLLLASCWAYFAWSWASGGQTVGMRAWRLVVRRNDGADVGLGRATVRYLAGWLSTLAVGIGFAWSLVDRNRLTWHDLLSQTELTLLPKLTKSSDRDQRDDQ